MALETKWDLEEKTIDKLQTLIRFNIDAYDGFKECAEEVDGTRLRELFLDLAKQRSNNATQLQSHVEWNNEDAEDDGSARAAVHRAWINVREALSGDNNNYEILAEAERGEDYIKDAYEDVLEDHPGSAMSDVIHEQYKGVKAAHDKIRDLRDMCKEED